MVDCCKGEKYGKGLFIEFEATDNTVAKFNGEDEVDEEIVIGNEGPLLVVRKACFTPVRLKVKIGGATISSNLHVKVRCVNLSLIRVAASRGVKQLILSRY